MGMKVIINGKEVDDLSHLGMINTFCEQLKTYRKQNKSPDERKHLELDIEGYEEILKSGSSENAENFMIEKHNALRSHRRYPNNMAVVDHLKSKGEWK